MIKTNEILETVNMIEKEHFDIRTVTMGCRCSVVYV